MNDSTTREFDNGFRALFCVWGMDSENESSTTRRGSSGGFPRKGECY